MLWKCIYHNHQQMKQLISIIQHNGLLAWMTFDMRHTPKHCWRAGTKDWTKETNVSTLPSKIPWIPIPLSIGWNLFVLKQAWSLKAPPHRTQGIHYQHPHVRHHRTPPRSPLSISWWIRPVLAAQEELAEYKAGQHLFDQTLSQWFESVCLLCMPLNLHYN